MDAHKDLFEAALNAVNAVEAKKNGTDPSESVEAVEDSVSAPPVEEKPEVQEVAPVERPERPANAPKPAARTARLPQFPGLAEMAVKARQASSTPSISAVPAAVPAQEVSAAKAEDIEKPVEPTGVEAGSVGLDLSALDVLESIDLDDDVSEAIEVALSQSEKKEAASVAEASEAEVSSAVDGSVVRALESKVAELEEILMATRASDATLRQENEQLKVLAKQLNERVVRVSADFDNYKKRVARDQEQNKNQAAERIVTGFLGVMDNLERALSHARQSNDYDQLLQGVEMTAKLFIGALGKQGCTPFDSLGAEFDPVYHDVLSRVIDSEKPHNSIIQEHLRGYIMHDRVLRPALVVVAQHEDGNGE